MPTLLSSLNTARPIDAELEQILEAAVAQLQAGQAVDVDQLAAAHPAHADALRELWPAIEVLAGLGAGGADATVDLPSAGNERDASHEGRPAGAARRQLGDFRILREIGRGGMGTVFEAEQLSMGRRVALKVLPFAALAHEKSLQRFRNEVRAAAALDHPHIVSVYSVGEERGIHYFAMQLIRGQTLADMIAALRPEAPSSLPQAKASGDAPTIDSALVRAAETQPTAHARVSTAVDSRVAAEHFRSAARMGVQAASALQHAHDMGILHRDIKPSNLMVDADGQIYVTDFGLARIEADAGMTMTGDIVGTLRYMAPEQALAKRVVVDQRADVYSLGATLYELLSGEPAFSETDRAELLKQIAFGEPRALRKIDRQIPIELETIVLKAMAKNPDERYQDAQSVVDDLQAYLDHRPIRAKPSSWLDQFVKWSRRHPAGVRASVLSLIVISTVAAATLGWAARDRSVRQAAAEAGARAALHQASQFAEQWQWANALTAINRADELLASSGPDGPLRPRVRSMKKDAEMALRLEENRFDPNQSLDDFRVYNPEADRNYADAFHDYGIDVDALSTRAAAEQIRQSRIAPELVEALDDWGVWRKWNSEDDEGWKKLFAVANAADTDSWRKQWRTAMATEDETLKSTVVKEALSEMENWDPHNVSRMFNLSLESIGLDQSIELLRAAQQRHPESFWVNFYLGNAFLMRERDAPVNAVRYISIALALKPTSWLPRNLLGVALIRAGNRADATPVLREALRLDPNNPIILTNLGHSTDDSDEALALYKEAIRLKPSSAIAHAGLGKVLLGKGLLPEAEASYKEAIRLDPEYAKCHSGVARVLKEMGRLSEAVDHFQTAIRLESAGIDLSVAHYQLNEAFKEMGLLDEARSLYMERLRHPQDLQPQMRKETLVSIYQLAESLRRVGRADEANQLYDETIQLQLSQIGLTHSDTLELYQAAGRLDEAITAGKESLASLNESGPDDPESAANRLFLARAFGAARRHEDAEQQMRELLTTTNDPETVRVARYLLADSLLRQGRSKEGTDVLNTLYQQRLQSLTAPDAMELRRAWPKLPNVKQAPEGTPGQDGLDFDGARDYVILPRLHFDGRPPWTLETIVKPAVIDRRFGTWTSLVSAASGGSIGVDSDQGRWSVGMYATPMLSEVWVQNYSSAPARVPIELAVWQHVAGVWDGQELRLYVDGELQARRKDVEYCTRLSLEPFFLGADPGALAQGYFHGRMRAARISRGVEYTKTFAAPDSLTKTAKTIALYDFTRDTGRYAIDSSGHGNHGIIVGAVFAKTR